MTPRRRIGAALAVLLALTVTVLSPVTPAQAAVVACDGGANLARRLPVVLVHGFNSSESTWDRASGRFAKDSGLCITRFDYADVSTSWVTDTRIGPALATFISDLAASSKKAGGPGQVVVVAHSMGGLATRCALAESCGGRADMPGKVAGVVTLGTPHLGSTSRGYGRSLLTDVAGPVLAAVCLTAVDARDGGFCKEPRALGTSEAAHAFTPGSDELDNLPHFPSSTPVLALSGTLQVTTGFWGLPRQVVGSLGDLAVSEDSALAEYHRAFGVGGQKALSCGSVDLVAGPMGTSHVDLGGYRCWHGTETSSPIFLDQVANFLTATEKRLRPLAPAPTGCEQISKAIAQWSDADLKYFVDAGGAMRAGPPYVDGKSFRVVYIPADSGSGDQYLERYDVGKGFTFLQPDDHIYGKEFPLILSLVNGGISCKIRTFG